MSTVQEPHREKGLGERSNQIFGTLTTSCQRC